MPHIINDPLDNFYYEINILKTPEGWSVTTEQPEKGVKYTSTFEREEQAKLMAATAISVVYSLIEKAVMSSISKDKTRELATTNYLS